MGFKFQNFWILILSHSHNIFAATFKPWPWLKSRWYVWYCPSSEHISNWKQAPTCLTKFSDSRGLTLLRSSSTGPGVTTTDWRPLLSSSVKVILSSEEWNTQQCHKTLSWKSCFNSCECGTIPCLCCELSLWLRKCMANCWRGPARPSSPGTDGGIMRGPEMPSFGAFSREPRVSSTLSTSSPQCLVNSLISICAQHDRV